MAPVRASGAPRLFLVDEEEERRNGTFGIDRADLLVTADGAALQAGEGELGQGAKYFLAGGADRIERKFGKPGGMVAGKGDHFVLFLIMGDEGQFRPLRHAIPRRSKRCRQ